MISVIVPVYNVKPYLKKCIESIIYQTYSDLEIILVDDGSTDGSELILDQFAMIDGRIIILHKNNAGQSAARNLGLSLSNGDWVGFVDSDDWIDLEFYEALLNGAESESADMSVCDRRVYDEQGMLIYEAKIAEGKTIKVKDVEEYYYEYFFKYTPSVCNKLFRRNAIENTRFHPIIEVGSEDTLFNFEIVFRLKRVREVTYVAYNSLARINSTARSYRVGDLKKHYHLLLKMLVVAQKNNISGDTCFCTYSYFTQRTWNQIKTYGSLNAREYVHLEIESEKNLPRKREFARKMLQLKTLNRMGYRRTGITAVKIIYLLKLLNANKLIEYYIFFMFIKE